MLHRCVLALPLVLLSSAIAFGQGPDIPPEPQVMWIDRLQRWLGDPTLVFLLFMFGISGVVAEASHPGTWFPGIVGVICLIFAFFGMQVLPINYVGVALIVLGLLLVLLEVKVHSAGALTIIGLTSLIAGSAFMVDPREGVERVSWLAVAPLTISIALVMMLLVRNVVRAHQSEVQTGMERMIGTLARVKGEMRGEGFVYVAGELWRARCNQTLEDGETVRIVAYDGLTLHVKPVP